MYMCCQYNCWGEPERATQHVLQGKKYCRGWTTTTDDDDVSSACDDINQDQQYGWGSMCTMRALQVDRLQRRRDLADGCKGLSSGSPLPMEFHSSSYLVSLITIHAFGICWQGVWSWDVHNWYAHLAVSSFMFWLVQLRRGHVSAIYI